MVREYAIYLPRLWVFRFDVKRQSYLPESWNPLYGLWALLRAFWIGNAVAFSWVAIHPSELPLCKLYDWRLVEDVPSFPGLMMRWRGE